jgi:hypothetical protein
MANEDISTPFGSMSAFLEAEKDKQRQWML